MGIPICTTVVWRRNILSVYDYRNIARQEKAHKSFGYPMIPAQLLPVLLHAASDWCGQVSCSSLRRAISVSCSHAYIPNYLAYFFPFLPPLVKNKVFSFPLSKLWFFPFLPCKVISSSSLSVLLWRGLFCFVFFSRASNLSSRWTALFGMADATADP